MDDLITKAALSGSLRSAANTNRVSMYSGVIGKLADEAISELEQSNSDLTGMLLEARERIHELELEKELIAGKLRKLQRITKIEVHPNDASK